MRFHFAFFIYFFFTVFYVNAQGPFNYYKKLSPALLQKQHIPSAILMPTNITVVCSNVDSVLNFCNKKRIPILSKHNSSGTIVLRCDSFQWREQLLKNQYIVFADETQTPKEEAAINSTDITVSGIRKTHTVWPTINGKNIVVSVKENLVDTADIDFAGRYVKVPFAATNYTNTHSTTMATLIGGGGNSNYTSKGIAWNAFLSSASFASILPESDQDYQQNNISVQNHSYGTTAQGYYGAEAMAYDISANKNLNLLHVFSIGNRGVDSGQGPYIGIPKFSNMTGNSKMAKNILTVGAVDRTGAAEALSSRGPAFDGRIKPELVSLGEDGSSGAAAMVSGTIALLQQQYKQQKGNLPASALVKAALINSADDVGAKGPDFVTGYGNLNTYKAVETIIQNRFFESALSNGDIRSFSVTIPASTAQLKITLCWNDPAATVNITKALVNDLDLEVTQQNTSNKWSPWVLNYFANVDSLNMPAARKKDTLNNIEQITIENPASGVYEIKVKGSFVNNGVQSFYLAYQTDTLNSFNWLFPVKGENLTSGAASFLRWKSGFSSTQPATLEANIASNWVAVDNNIQLAKGYSEWKVPDYIEAASQLRMTINGQRYISDNFTISKMLNTNVGFICGDSFMIYWNKIPGINRYQLYQLGEQYLQPISVVQDTFIIQKVKPNSKPYYSVSPLLGGTIAGEKSYTFKYNDQGVACYIQNFLADRVDQSAILQLSIGTNYMVKSITFEKLLSNGITNLSVINPGSSTTFSYKDVFLRIGQNRYRAKITLLDGQVLYTDIRTLYGFGIYNQLVYPTFLTAGQRISVVIPNVASDYTFQIIDMLGKVVLEQKLVLENESVLMPVLSRGVYFYVIYNNGKREQSGKIVIQ